MMHGWGLGPMWLGWVVWIAIGIIFIWLILRLVAFKPKVDKDAYTDPQQSAEDILKKRYASGEITRKEYEEIKSSL